MRISELARTTGVPLPTVKYYLREGLVPPGRATAATQAEYGPAHVARLRLIRALVDIAGLPLSGIREVLGAIDGDDASPEAVGRAVSRTHNALSPGTTPDVDPVRARALVERLGWDVDPATTELRRLEGALTTLDGVGLHADDDRLDVYAAAALEVARIDVGAMTGVAADEALLTVVAGTVLYEPILLALRRLAQQHVYAATPPRGAS